MLGNSKSALNLDKAKVTKHNCDIEGSIVFIEK